MGSIYSLDPGAMEKNKEYLQIFRRNDTNVVNKLIKVIKNVKNRIGLVNFFLKYWQEMYYDQGPSETKNISPLSFLLFLEEVEQNLKKGEIAKTQVARCLYVFLNEQKIQISSVQNNARYYNELLGDTALIDNAKKLYKNRGETQRDSYQTDYNMQPQNYGEFQQSNLYKYLGDMVVRVAFQLRKDKNLLGSATFPFEEQNL